MRNTLIELGHPQPPDGTPIRTDNNTANGIMNHTVKPKRSKSMDMRFWWLADRVEQNQFRIHWAPGSVNLADYFTKKHPASHHAKVRPIYLYMKGKSPNLLQGCDKILTSGTTTRQTSATNGQRTDGQTRHPGLKQTHTKLRLVANHSSKPLKTLKAITSRLSAQLVNSLV